RVSTFWVGDISAALRVLGFGSDVHCLKRCGVNLSVMHGVVTKEYWMSVGSSIQFGEEFDVIERRQRTTPNDTANNPLTRFKIFRPSCHFANNGFGIIGWINWQLVNQLCAGQT